MGVIDTMKDVAGLIQKYDNIDLVRRLAELQQQVYDLVDGNRALQEEHRALKERLATRDQLAFRKNSYWRGEDGPFCSRCWE